MNYECWNINGHSLEFLDDSHTYLVDGCIVPSVTQIMKVKFGSKYDFVDSETLNRAAERGTEIHLAIQRYCEEDLESDLPEVRNFKFLQKQYKMSVLENEVPVVLFGLTRPICAGRLDMIAETEKDGFCICDIKTTSTLDKEYLSLQLNLYAIAYQQCYGHKVDSLKGIHLRGDKRKFVSIPINEQKTWDFINEYWKGEENGDL